MISRQHLLFLLLSFLPTYAQGIQNLNTPAKSQREEYKVETKGVYTSPSGLFTLPIPVWASLGGRIEDDNMYVNFMDDYTSHITVGVIQMDATFRWELATMGKKDFLIRVFNSVFMPQFRAACAETSSDSAKLIPKFKDGALLIGTLHPGMSHFINRTRLFGSSDPLVTGRRGTLLFTQGDYIFIISSELGQRATERSVYGLAASQENDILKDRLLQLAKGMSITLPEAETVSP